MADKLQQVAPQEVVNIPTPVGPTRYVECKVINEIFKMGKTHKAGSKVVLELFCAENFATAGDIEIVKEVQK